MWVGSLSQGDSCDNSVVLATSGGFHYQSHRVLIDGLQVALVSEVFRCTFTLY